MYMSTYLAHFVLLDTLVLYVWAAAYYSGYRVNYMNKVSSCSMSLFSGPKPENGSMDSTSFIAKMKHGVGATSDKCAHNTCNMVILWTCSYLVIQQTC